MLDLGSVITGSNLWKSPCFSLKRGIIIIALFIYSFEKKSDDLEGIQIPDDSLYVKLCRIALSFSLGKIKCLL